MLIKFNEVTWYSKLGALALFLLVVPITAFYIGMKYEETILVIGQVGKGTSPHMVNHVQAPALASYSASSSVDVFDSDSRSPKNSNTIGYFAGGAFYMYVPDWIAEHWNMVNMSDGGMTLSPQEDVVGRDFSDIVISVATSTERFNAETLYSRQASTMDSAFCFSDSRCEVRPDDSDLITSEVMLSTVGDTRIYHLAASSSDDMIMDSFFIDSGQVTAMITFSAKRASYDEYESKIRGFIQGIGKTIIPQG